MYYHWLYITSFVDVFATSLLVPFLAVHLGGAGFGRLRAGILTTVYPTVQLLVSPAAGLFSDRYGHKQTLVCSLLACAVAYFGFGTAACPLSMFLWRVALGLLKHTQTLCKSLLVVIGDKKTTQFGTMNAAEALGFMLGPIVGAHLIESNMGFKFLCNTTSCLFILNALIVCCCCPKIEYQKLVNTSVDSDYLAVNNYQEELIVNWSIFCDILILKWLQCVSLSVFYTNYAFITVEQFKVAPRVIGYTNSFQSFISIITALISTKISNSYSIKEPYTKFQVCFFILSISLLCSGLVTNFSAFIFCLVPLSVSSTLLKIYTTEVLINRNSSTSSGSLIGLENTISSIAFLLSPFIVEICTMCFGIFSVPFFSSIVSGAGAYVSFLSVFKILNSTKHIKCTNS